MHYSSVKLAFFYVILIIAILLNHNIANSKLTKIEIEDLELIRPKTAIVLSGGGARGIAQIGILKQFEQNNIKIDYIIGTSIGAIMGSLYSSGYKAEEIENIIKSLNWNEIYSIGKETNRSELFFDQKAINDRSILSLRFNNFKFIIPEAISIGTKFTYFLNYILWNAPYQPLTSFDDLKYKFRAISTDVIHGETVSFKGGNLATTVRASSTLPLKFSPVRYDNKILVDGGIFANIPAQQALEFSPDLIIVFNTTTPLLVQQDLNNPWNLADQVVSIQMKKFENSSSKVADLIITPELKNQKNSDFENLDTLIKIGEIATIPQIKSIQEKINKYKDSVLSYRIREISKIDFSTTKIKFEGLDSDTIQALQKNAINTANDFKELIKSLNGYNKIEIVYDDFDSTLMLKTNIYRKIKNINIITSDTNIKNLIQDTIDVLFNNMTFNENQDNELKEIILKHLISKGYNLSTVNIFTNQSQLNIEINTPKLNNIFITGNLSTNEKLILRNLKLKIGDYINAEKLAQSWEDIFNTNLFSSVDMQILRNNYNASADLYITLKEIGSQAINLGLQIDETKKTRIGIDLLEENFMNVGMRLNFRFIGGEREIFNDLILEQPRLLNTFFTYKMQAYYHYQRKYNYQLINDFTAHEFRYSPLKDIGSQALGAKLSVGSQIKKSGRIAIEGRYESQRFYIWDAAKQDKGSFYSINTIKLDANFDTENKHYFPSSGYLLNLSLETNLFNIKNNVSFSKAIFNYKYNHSKGDFTISPMLSFGFSDKTTPYPEFFDLHQNTGFYGILEGQEIGRQLAKAQLDIRYKPHFKLFFDTYFSFRYDIGSVWLMPEQIKISSLIHGIGASIQLDTPIGPAIFSLGKSFKFTKDPALLVLGPLAFYYNIGINL